MIRLLTTDDVDAYAAYMVAHSAESGTDGDPHFQPYSSSTPLPLAETRDLALQRWTTPLTESGWRRALGAFAGETIVGHAYLAGGHLDAELHRVTLGMGVRRSHRRQGLGRRLTEAAIHWTREQPGIDWLDLGVFTENTVAFSIYQKLGFEELGRTRDRFRVEGHQIHDVSMALYVGGEDQTP